jgi:DNA-binding NarL/FixJ family response regulator
VSDPAPTRVVLVEDNAIYRSSLELLLGMEPRLEIVAAVENGTEALAAIEQLHADVVIVDMRLPDISGVELTATVRDLDVTAQVICLTAEATFEERAAALEAGAVEVVEKGGPIERLVDVVLRAAER